MKKENLRDGKLKFPANLVDSKLIDAGIHEDSRSRQRTNDLGRHGYSRYLS